MSWDSSGLLLWSYLLTSATAKQTSSPATNSTHGPCQMLSHHTRALLRCFHRIGHCQATQMPTARQSGAVTVWGYCVARAGRRNNSTLPPSHDTHTTSRASRPRPHLERANEAGPMDERYPCPTCNHTPHTCACLDAQTGLQHPGTPTQLRRAPPAGLGLQYSPAGSHAWPQPVQAHSALPVLSCHFL